MARWLTRVTATLGGLFILGFAGFAVWAAIAGDTGWLGDVPTWIASAMVVCSRRRSSPATAMIA